MQIDFRASASASASAKESRMVDNFLSSLSDTDLLIETKAAIKIEREATAVVVRFFKEINDRELYLKHACSSLFQFATEKLGYCAASAQARINAMRMIQVLPEVEAKIESGALSLTAVSKVQTFLNLEKKENRTYSIEERREILDACVSKSTREVERELAKRNPNILKIETMKPVGHDRFQVSFSISEETEVKMKKLRALFAHANPNISLEQLFEKLVELGLEKFDPARKAERTQKRVEKNISHSSKMSFADKNSEPGKLGALTGIEDSEIDLDRSFRAHEMKRSRYVASSVRHQVWSRNQNQGCEFVSEMGELCGSQLALQIDHVEGFALGGSNQADNLRVLCAKHNRFLWKSQFRA